MNRPTTQNYKDNTLKDAVTRGVNIEPLMYQQFKLKYNTNIRRTFKFCHQTINHLNFTLLIVFKQAELRSICLRLFC